MIAPLRTASSADERSPARPRCTSVPVTAPRSAPHASCQSCSGGPACSSSFSAKSGITSPARRTSTRNAWADEIRRNASAFDTSVSRDMKERPLPVGSRLDALRSAGIEHGAKRAFRSFQRHIDIGIRVTEAEMIALQVHWDLEHAALHEFLTVPHVRTAIIRQQILEILDRPLRHPLISIHRADSALYPRKAVTLDHRLQALAHAVAAPEDVRAR